MLHLRPLANGIMRIYRGDFHGLPNSISASDAVMARLILRRTLLNKDIEKNPDTIALELLKLLDDEGVSERLNRQNGMCQILGAIAFAYTNKAEAN